MSQNECWDLQLHDQVVVTSTLVEVLQPHHVVMLYPERMSDKHSLKSQQLASSVVQCSTLETLSTAITCQRPCKLFLSTIFHKAVIFKANISKHDSLVEIELKNIFIFNPYSSYYTGRLCLKLYVILYSSHSVITEHNNNIFDLTSIDLNTLDYASGNKQCFSIFNQQILKYFFQGCMYYEKMHSKNHHKLVRLKVEHFFRFVLQTFADQITEETLRIDPLTARDECALM